MKCLNCNAPLGAINFCSSCGADMSILKRVERISNLNYNEGLDKATVRDLSGAIVCLKRSLKFNKYNIQARNLLGLVYFEIGEVVSALSEWVISENLQPDDNEASEFIAKLQANPNRLNTINQTIKKYNQSLTYCQEGSDDMAIIQLKKILIQNPKFIKGYQLLALIYLKVEQYERARKVLKKAMRIDNTNTITLRYIRSVDEATRVKTVLAERIGRKKERVTDERRDGNVYYISDRDTIIQPATFQESSIIATFINLIIGLIVGGAVIYCLVVPGKVQEVTNDANKEIAQYGEQISSLQTQLSTLQNQVNNSEAQIASANTSMDLANTRATNYTNIIKVANEIEKEDIASKDAAVTIFEGIDKNLLDVDAQGLYDSIKVKVDAHLHTKLQNDGVAAFTATQYPEAITALARAKELGELSDIALEALAKSYYHTAERAKSNELFNELILRIPSRELEWITYLQE
jgi:Tfp pilus assembly protein PilF